MTQGWALKNFKPLKYPFVASTMKLFTVFGVEPVRNTNEMLPLVVTMVPP
jgi:hypothetical protein